MNIEKNENKHKQNMSTVKSFLKYNKKIDIVNTDDATRSAKVQ